MKTKNQIIISLIAISFMFASCFNDKKQETKSLEIESNEPALEVNSEFLKAYMSGNQVAADEKYKDKIFLVRGMILEITNMFEPIVKVETEVGEVECVFDKSQSSELAKLSTAQQVVIECTFKGIIMSARFENSKIISVSEQ
jgi:hypothetical protein